MSDYDEGKRVALAFLVGAVIGAGIALIYAPQSGSETRRDISKTARRIKKKSGEFVDDAVDSIHEFVDDVKDLTSDIVDRGMDLSEGAKKEIVKALEHGQKSISKQKDRVLEALKLS